MKSLKVNVYALVILTSIFLLISGYIRRMPFRGYYDDIVALIFLILLFIGMNKITYEDKKIIICLTLIIIIGVFSNVIFRVVPISSDILNDIWCFLRMFIVFLGTCAIFGGKKIRLTKTVAVLAKLGKVFILLSFLFCILNLAGIVNMYVNIRYGLKCFSFFFRNASQFGVFVGAILGFVILDDEINHKGRTKLYEICAIIVLIMTIKGMSWIIAAVYIVLSVFAKYGLKWWHIVIGTVVLFFALQFQINFYLLDDKAPRAVLIYYGFITAIRYLPLGAGYATYGSNIAGVHYSPLYIEYGFQDRKALSRYSYGYLNDVYLGMVVGETGFIGLAFTMAILYNIGIRILRAKSQLKKSRNIVLACFACMCGMTVMAGSVKNGPGEVIMMLCGFYIVANKLTDT